MLAPDAALCVARFFMPSALLNSLARSNTLLLLLLRSAFFGGGAPPGAAPAGQMMGVEIKAPLTFRTFRTFKAKRSALQENSRHSGRSEHSRQKTLPYKKVQGILLSRNPKALCRTKKPMAPGPFRTFKAKHSAVQENSRHPAEQEPQGTLPYKKTHGTLAVQNIQGKALCHTRKFKAPCCAGTPRQPAVQENPWHSGRSEHSKQNTLLYKKIQGTLLSRNSKALCHTRKPMALWPFRTFKAKHSG